jgi:CelD/BcsL family acetyltransferase involved in cellulose biosynthesis
MPARATAEILADSEDVSSEPGRLSAALVDGLAGFLQLEREWRKLVQVAGTRNPFLCWEWVSEWVSEFCGDRLLTAVIRDAGAVVAIAPFYRNSYMIGPGVRATCLQLFGPREDQHIFEQREILIDPKRQSGVLTSIVECLSAQPVDWIELAAQGDAVQALEDALRAVPPSMSPRTRSRTVVPIMALRQSWDVQHRALKRNVKESIRHCYNSLKRDGHRFTVSIEVSSDQADGSLDTFLRLYQQRSALSGRARHFNHFSTERRRRFLSRAVRRMMEAGSLEFCTVKIGDEVVASRICMTMLDTLYLYYSGLDPRYWRYSPTTLLVTERLRRAIDQQLCFINFSPGTDQSKTRWGVDLVPRLDVTVVSRNPIRRLKFTLISLRKSDRFRNLYWRIREGGSELRTRDSHRPPDRRRASPGM